MCVHGGDEAILHFGNDYREIIRWDFGGRIKEGEVRGLKSVCVRTEDQRPSHRSV